MKKIFRNSQTSRNKITPDELIYCWNQSILADWAICNYCFRGFKVVKIVERQVVIKMVAVSFEQPIHCFRFVCVGCIYFLLQKVNICQYPGPWNCVHELLEEESEWQTAGTQCLKHCHSRFLDLLTSRFVSVPVLIVSDHLLHFSPTLYLHALPPKPSSDHSSPRNIPNGLTHRQHRWQP